MLRGFFSLNILLISRKLVAGENVSEYVKYLSEYLVDSGHKVTLAVLESGSGPSLDKEVSVESIHTDFDSGDFYNQIMMLNNYVKSLDELEDFDLVHANDWSTVPAAVSVSSYQEIPMFFTLHSTEYERGFGDQHSQSISDMELKGVENAEVVFVNREETRKSVVNDLGLSEEKIDFVDPLSEAWQNKVESIYQETQDNRETEELVR